MIRKAARLPFCLILFSLVVFAVGVAAASAQSDDYTDGQAAQLSAANIKSLGVLKAAVALPTYLPAGYKLKKVTIQKPEADIVAFSFNYEDAAGKSFTIESNNEALGDMAVKREVRWSSKLFKDTAQESGDFHAGHDENDAKTVASEWLCSTSKYQPKGSTPQCFQLVSQSLSPAEVMKVMASLRYLKR
jgi:hypothetical protein